MSAFFDIMLFPALACLILTVTHAYLGYHVLQRGVIFVDLALAQLAALGATFGFLFGFALHSTGSYFFSLAFTLFGALVLAVTRTHKAAVPHEAIIGIVYAVAGAASILLLNQSAEGGEELKNLLVGHLLFVDKREVLTTFVLYALVGLVHVIFHKTFFAISDGSYQGSALKRWDFLFYATFGFIVTSSVEMAGVLLVFAFLVCPATCGALLAQSMRGRLLIGWATSVLVTLAGMAMSYYLDWPTGATVVVCFGAATFICGIARICRGEPL